MSMGVYSYITNRVLENKTGQGAGRLRILVKTGSSDAEIEYVCPECTDTRSLVQPWKRPFSVRCQKCGAVMKVPKLKKMK